MATMKLYIARDEGLKLRYRHPKRGKLHIFYDTPVLQRDYVDNLLKWSCARVICEVPSYMYPNIKEKECVVFEMINK